MGERFLKDGADRCDVNLFEATILPGLHRAFMNTEKTDHILNRIGTMNFDVAMVWVVLAHDSAHREQHTRVWQYRKVHGGRVILFLEWSDVTRRACHITHPPD